MLIGLAISPVAFGAPPPPILTLLAALGYPAAGAWSVSRRLRLLHATALIRVRRSSDNAEQDIGATAAGALDTVALLAFCGAGSGFVAKAYDQSGGGYDLVQATAAAQPRIVNAGVLDAIGARAAMQGLSGGILENASYTHGDAATLAVVADDSAGAVASGRFILSSAVTSGNANHIRGDGSVRLNGVTATTPDTSLGRKVLIGWAPGVGSVTQTVERDGVVTGPTAITRAASVPGIGLGGVYGSTSLGFTGRIAEAHVFRAALPDELRALLRRDMGAHYGITVA